MLAAYRDASQVYSAQEWLQASAVEMSERGLSWELLYIAALFASQTRDMIPRMPATAGFLMRLHHWVVVCLSVASPSAPKQKSRTRTLISKLS